MGEPTINGDMPKSVFLEHLASYPIISDSISGFKANPYGQKSIAIADSGYAKFGKPVLPYLSKPYGYISPYVSKADVLAENGLSKIDSKFPIVKEETEKVKGTVTDIAFFPIIKAKEGKEYVFKTYDGEYKKVGGAGLVTSGKALITTGLVVTSDALAWFGSFLSAKKEEAKAVASEKSG